MARKKTELILEGVTVEKVAAEGNAIAHVDSVALFIPFAVPGDVVKVKVTKKKKNYMEGYILDIEQPSPSRLKPFCKYFGVCGGCKWQPLPYDMQLQAKCQQVQDQLVRIGHLDIPQVRPTLPSENTQYYRNKLEFTFSERRWLYPDEDWESISSEERLGLGFHVGRFFDKVLDIRECFLQGGSSNAIRNFIRDWAISHQVPFFNIREHTGLLRNMIIRTTRKGEVMLIVVFHENDQKTIKALFDALLERFPEIVSLYYVINPKANDSVGDLDCILYHGDEAIYETMENLRFKIGPKSFYQTNTEQAERLYGVAREFAQLSGSETVYDLYTGTGTIAQFISSKAKKVIGIEYVPEAIEDAKANAAANGIKNCEFFAGDMKDVLTEDFISVHGRPDVIILDPPRAGIHPDVAAVILKAAPSRMVYVSCNPASQARDLEILCNSAAEDGPHYRITAVQPVDMFPHTHHVENVVALIKE